MLQQRLQPKRSLRKKRLLSVARSVLANLVQLQKTWREELLGQMHEAPSVSVACPWHPRLSTSATLVVTPWELPSPRASSTRQPSGRSSPRARSRNSVAAMVPFAVRFVPLAGFWAWQTVHVHSAGPPRIFLAWTAEEVGRCLESRHQSEVSCTCPPWTHSTLSKFDDGVHRWSDCSPCPTEHGAVRPSLVSLQSSVSHSHPPTPERRHRPPQHQTVAMPWILLQMTADGTLLQLQTQAERKDGSSCGARARWA
mmetsp:Transcript_49783/g.132016  ORF Transcript_49783/g.132016 Transcript_49783/m.132016 type:complete len:254 (-) Transcript_49783:3086-3847(-)